MNRDMGVFNDGGCFGFEEIIRDFLVCSRDQKKFNKRMLGEREFTCVVESLKAQILHLNLDIVIPIL